MFRSNVVLRHGVERLGVFRSLHISSNHWRYLEYQPKTQSSYISSFFRAKLLKPCGVPLLIFVLKRSTMVRARPAIPLLYVRLELPLSKQNRGSTPRSSLLIVFPIKVLLCDHALSFRYFKLDIVLLLLLVDMPRRFVVTLQLAKAKYLNFPEEVPLLGVQLLLVAEVRQFLVYGFLALHFCKKLSF